jgi:hypothetical protein
LLHRTSHRVVRKCLLVLLSRDTYQFCHATTSIPCCDRRAARKKEDSSALFLFPTLLLTFTVKRKRRMAVSESSPS